MQFEAKLETPETKTICSSYTNQGFCMKGDNCESIHPDAVSVREKEFFATWEVIKAEWLKIYYQKRKEIGPSEEELRIERERQRIQKEVARRKMEDLENEDRELKKQQKALEKRKLLGRLVVEQALSVQKQEAESNEIEVQDHTVDASKSIESDNDLTETGGIQEPPEPEVECEKVEFELDPERCKGIDFNQPRIPPSPYYHVPLKVRQKALEKIIDALKVKYESEMQDSELARKRAIVESIEKEIELHNECSNKNVYWQAACSLVKKFKKYFCCTCVVAF
ncbi:hypothetical protein AKO1_010783 [Acrasis kona]|uniref:C3H1-type domain-containing protein n=1 Tax=Acrasis kona TaxID=1008807 RepID=A0AAW2YL95_9EUKA